MEQSFMATRKLFFGRWRGVTATQSVWRQLKSPVTLTFPGSWHLWDFSAGGNTVLILYFSWKPLRIYCPPVVLPSLLTHVLSLCSAYCFSCIISNLVIVPYFSSVFNQVSNKIVRPGFEQIRLIFHLYINDSRSPSLVPCSVFPVPPPLASFKHLQRASSVNLWISPVLPSRKTTICSLLSLPA